MKETKTIFVVYTTETDMNKVKSMKLHRYAFNTKEDLKVGDIIISDNYETPMVVVSVLDFVYTYVNVRTGELLNEVNSTYCYPIRMLEEKTVEEDVIYFTKK